VDVRADAVRPSVHEVLFADSSARYRTNMISCYARDQSAPNHAA
jgi:hypothetical protein